MLLILYMLSGLNPNISPDNMYHSNEVQNVKSDVLLLPFLLYHLLFSPPGGWIGI